MNGEEDPPRPPLKVIASKDDQFDGKVFFKIFVRISSILVKIIVGTRQVQIQLLDVAFFGK